jgi:hypothetical protein
LAAVRSSRYISVVVITVVLAAACSSQPTEPGDVLEAWVDAAMVGDVETAQSYIAGSDIPWIGLGDSPEAFAAGAGPYEATNIFIECRTDHILGRCETWWGDLWIGAIPELAGLEDRGDAMLRMTAEVEDGRIVAFRDWVFAPEIRRAFELHLDWLAVHEPDKLEAACGPDPAGAPCSRLLVDTVGTWVADR